MIMTMLSNRMISITSKRSIGGVNMLHQPQLLLLPTIVSLLEHAPQQPLSSTRTTSSSFSSSSSSSSPTVPPSFNSSSELPPPSSWIPPSTRTPAPVTTASMNQNKYVWNEPPGRMKLILDKIRMTEKRLNAMKNKTLPKIKDVCKRIRLNDSALVSRTDLLMESYEECAAGMQQLREAMQHACQKLPYLIPIIAQIPKRRKYIFQSKKENAVEEVDDTKKHSAGTNDNDDDATTTTIRTSPFTFQRNTQKYDAPDHSNNPNNPLLTELLRFDKTK